MNRRERRRLRKELLDRSNIPPEVNEALKAQGIIGRVGKVQIGGNTNGMVEVVCVRCGRSGHMPADDAPGVGAMCMPCVGDVMDGKP